MVEQPSHHQLENRIIIIVLTGGTSNLSRYKKIGIALFWDSSQLVFVDVVLGVRSDVKSDCVNVLDGDR